MPKLALAVAVVEQPARERAARKKRRVRSPHPGVVLIKPDGFRPYWRARYTDPDTNVSHRVKVDPLACTSAEARRDWAVQKAKALAKRRMAIEGGAPKATGAALADVLGRYFDAHASLRPRTLVIYRAAVDKLEAWSRKGGIERADELTRAKLMAFREHLVKQRKRVAQKGGKRGVRKLSTEPRSPAAVNQELRSVLTVLRYVCDLDLLSSLTHDDLRRSLKRLPVVSDRIEFLNATECGQLLMAALRHDAAVFDLTREEHAGKRDAGTTPRYTAIAPFTLFMLMTGMRVGEALALTWKQVDLDALDADGNQVGEIHLGNADTKTKLARTVGMEVSPALRELLVVLKDAASSACVFNLSRGEAETAGDRLKRSYGAPATFTWQALRRTCGTFLTNAPGIFGAATAYRSARQLGHSVSVAEKSYLGVLRGLPRDARTLERAMLIDDIAQGVIARAAAGAGKEPLNVIVARSTQQGKSGRAGEGRRHRRAR